MQAPSSDPLGTPVPPAARSSLPWWALALPALAFAALLLLAFGPTAPSASAAPSCRSCWSGSSRASATTPADLGEHRYPKGSAANSLRRAPVSCEAGNHECR
ncbi:hypothetical protein ACFQVA_07235 [Actinomadura keratinilytica]